MTVSIAQLLVIWTGFSELNKLCIHWFCLVRRNLVHRTN